MEDHVGFDAEPGSARDEPEPVDLPGLLLHVRVGRAEHDVDGLRMALENRRQRVDHVLDALVGREQAKRQEHGLAGDAELMLSIACGQARDPVRDPVPRVPPANAPSRRPGASGAAASPPRCAG